MAVNAELIRKMRAQKDNKVREAFRRKGGNMLPFLEPSELTNGEFYFRLWPEDPQKNPLGFLVYISHTIEVKPASGDKPNPERITYQCPRSSNWDPLAEYWEDEDGHALPEDVEPSREQGHRPVYRERCWVCELFEQMAELGLTNDRLPEHLQGVLTGVSGSGGWDGLQGSLKYFYPATFKLVVHSREKLQRADGSPFEKVIYSPGDPRNPEHNHHALLSLRQPSIYNKIDEIMELSPDINNLITGRNLILIKSNDGKGRDGYNVRAASSISAADFQVPTNLYPNLMKWGSGGQQRASKRLSYIQQESLGATAWWADDLRAYGIAMTDAEANAAPDPNTVPWQ